MIIKYKKIITFKIDSFKLFLITIDFYKKLLVILFTQLIIYTMTNKRKCQIKITFSKIKLDFKKNVFN